MAIGMEEKVILKQFQLNVRCSTTPLTDDCYIEGNNTTSWPMHQRTH